MPVRQVFTAGRVPVKIYTDQIEPDALRQLNNLARLDIVHGHVAAMPDVHSGIGTTVGAVIATRNAIIPAAVGVDIGCGMNAIRLSLRVDQLPDNLRSLRSAIESAVPVGFEAHAVPALKRSQLTAMERGLEAIVARHPGIAKMQRQFSRTWALQLGTLGGGNHFIELCGDESGQVWVMLHSGSRGIGNVIGRYFIELARKEMRGHLAQLPDLDLAYFSEGSSHFDDYVAAVGWAQDYAILNRKEMMRLVVSALRSRLPPFEPTAEAINCHHNYVTREFHFNADVYVTRKGAIRAGAGELGIIPGSMGTKSYIVRGMGNPESLCSCAHGAGRRMSRTAAKKKFTREDLERQTKGVECRKDNGVLDEIPAAYKDIDEVMQNQSDLVAIVHVLKQFICVKG